MSLLIAADGGGSKTDAVIFDETGHILGRCLGPGTMSNEIGEEEAVRRINEMIERLSAEAAEPISAVFGGIAGVISRGDFFSSRLTQRVAIRSRRFEDDAVNLLSAALGRADGCGMVCGTGASLQIWREGRFEALIGGKGYLIDTRGSGFDLGRDAIQAAYMAIDGRGEATVLTELISQKLERPLNDGAIPIFYRGGRAYIASFAYTVFEGLKQEDEVSRQIFLQNARCMAELIRAAASHFSDSFTVVAGGGVVEHFPVYFEQIRAFAPSRARLILLDRPPVYGAALEAMRDARLPVDGDFSARFLSDYAALSAP